MLQTSPLRSSPRRARRARSLGAALALALAACAPASAPKPQAPEARRREATRVRVAPVERREMVRTLSTTAVVASENEIRIFPRVTGIVVEVRVEEGDRVRADDLLAVVDARESAALLEERRVALKEAEDAVSGAEISRREAQSRVTGLEATWQQAQRDFERNEKNKGLISESALDAIRVARDRARAELETGRIAAESAAHAERAAKTAVERARIQLELQELAHSYTRIVAPFSGVIAQRSVKVGDTVTSGEVLGTGTAAFVLTDTDHLRCIVHRPQRELGLFAPERAGLEGEHAGALSGGAAIRATTEALPGLEFPGTIKLVSPSIDPASGAFRVTIGLDRPAGHEGPWLLPGMLARLTIVTDRHPDALVVPKRSLRREGDRVHLFAVRAGRARRVELREGFSDDLSVEVLPEPADALAPGDQVVVVGNRDLEPGEEVAIAPAAPEDVAPMHEGHEGPEAAEQPAGEAAADASGAASGDASGG